MSIVKIRRGHTGQADFVSSECEVSGVGGPGEGHWYLTGPISQQGHSDDVYDSGWDIETNGSVAVPLDAPIGQYHINCTTSYTELGYNDALGYEEIEYCRSNFVFEVVASICGCGGT